MIQNMTASELKCYFKTVYYMFNGGPHIGRCIVFVFGIALGGMFSILKL